MKHPNFEMHFFDCFIHVEHAFLLVFLFLSKLILMKNIFIVIEKNIKSMQIMWNEFQKTTMPKVNAK